MYHADNHPRSIDLTDITFSRPNRALHYTLDSSGKADITVVPISMVAEGTFEGCYDTLRIWVNTDGEYLKRLIGYVRIVFHEENVPLVYYRRIWSDEWQLFGAPRSGLAHALRTLYARLYEMSELGEELGVPVSDPSTSYYALLNE